MPTRFSAFTKMLRDPAVYIDTLADVKQRTLFIIEAVYPATPRESFNLDASTIELGWVKNHGVIFACQVRDGVGCPVFVSVIAISAPKGFSTREPPRDAGRKMLSALEDTVGTTDMKVSLRDLDSNAVTKVVIESVDLSLYIAHATVDKTERVITDHKGKVLKTRNLLEMQRTLRKRLDCEFFLRQRSAYDEMVGHQHRATDNCMELPLGCDPLPPWLN